MQSRKRDGEAVRAFCDDLYPDDGHNPRDDMRGREMAAVGDDRKLRQLCKQALIALKLAIAAIRMPVGVRVLSVEPVPNAGRLRALIAVDAASEVEPVRESLEASRGFLRSEIAEAVTRRRAPELVVVVIVDSRDANDDHA